MSIKDADCEPVVGLWAAPAKARPIMEDNLGHQEFGGLLLSSGGWVGASQYKISKTTLSISMIVITPATERAKASLADVVTSKPLDLHVQRPMLQLSTRYRSSSASAHSTPT
jgi:hypothetical protein